MYFTIQDATQALQEVEQTVLEDQGEDAVEAAWADLVYTVVDQCVPDVGRELLRRQGL
jgi:hypothetical protein